MYDILVVDDDPQTLEMIESVLRREGYRAQTTGLASEALSLVREKTPDLILIDAMLPDLDGLALCKKLREIPDIADIPIVFVTGQDSPYSVAEALSAGGDDYIRKPFVPRELTARIRAHIRRSFFIEGDVPTIRIFPQTSRVFVNEREVNLTRVEFDLLHYMCAAPDRPHSPEDLLTNVWNYPGGVGDAALVRNHIHNLRHKLEIDPLRPALIQSRHGRGYVIKAHVKIMEEEPA
ncbi:MAG: response regulator transcription factor [Chloroflexota bacterium]|nr:MAG: DNA-binding response regulator [Chloroflexota bacterium]